jgi:hypothetical protein
VKTLINTTLALAATVTPAFAAGNGAEHYGLLAWTFCGFCALVVVAQAVPAVLLMAGMIKGLVTREAHEPTN